VPTYEYTCKQCANRFEVMVPSEKKAAVCCPQCNCCDLQEVYTLNVSKAGKHTKGESCAQSESCPSKRFGFG
jgi:putative FmdB family regulatory protein